MQKVKTQEWKIQSGDLIAALPPPTATPHSELPNPQVPQLYQFGKVHRPGLFGKWRIQLLGKCRKYNPTLDRYQEVVPDLTCQTKNAQRWHPQLAGGEEIPIAADPPIRVVAKDGIFYRKLIFQNEDQLLLQRLAVQIREIRCKQAIL